MKTLLLRIVPTMLLLLSVSASAFGQGCYPPGGGYTQAQVDAVKSLAQSQAAAASTTQRIASIDDGSALTFLGQLGNIRFQPKPGWTPAQVAEFQEWINSGNFNMSDGDSAYTAGRNAEDSGDAWMGFGNTDNGSGSLYLAFMEYEKADQSYQTAASAFQNADFFYLWAAASYSNAIAFYNNN